MKLIKDWPQAYRWWSVHGALTVAILSALYAAFPALQGIVNPTFYAITMFVLGLAIIGLRVLQQGPKELPANQDGMD